MQENRLPAARSQPDPANHSLHGTVLLRNTSEAWNTPVFEFPTHGMPPISLTYYPVCIQPAEKPGGAPRSPRIAARAAETSGARRFATRSSSPQTIGTGVTFQLAANLWCSDNCDMHKNVFDFICILLKEINIFMRTRRQKGKTNFHERNLHPPIQHMTLYLNQTKVESPAGNKSRLICILCARAEANRRTSCLYAVGTVLRGAGQQGWLAALAAVSLAGDRQMCSCLTCTGRGTL